MKAESVREADNITNIAMKSITIWAKNNKINFNEQKSKVMVISRRNRKENKEILVYMNNKPLEEVKTIKYLGIITDSKLNFREHIVHISGKCTKLIHTLSQSAKQCRGLATKLCKLHTKAQFYHFCCTARRYGLRHCIQQVQRLINIKIAKSFQTTSNESPCTLTGLIPMVINAEEAAKLYNIMRKS